MCCFYGWRFFCCCVDGEADVSEGGGEGGGGGGGKAGGEAMILYLIGNLFQLRIKDAKRLHKLEIWQI